MVHVMLDVVRRVRASSWTYLHQNSYRRKESETAVVLNESRTGTGCEAQVECVSVGRMYISSQGGLNEYIKRNIKISRIGD